MLCRLARSRRRGAALVEAAIVYPVFLMFILGTITIGLGVSDYHRVALMAREGARWAAVHGGQYSQDIKSGTLRTPENVYTAAIVPLASGLDEANSLTYSVTWDDSQQMPGTYKDANGDVVNDVNGNPKQNSVTVTVNYQWTPLLYITGPITLTSTSNMVISY
jgi:Flp pilus assembly protein TadG